MDGPLISFEYSCGHAVAVGFDDRGRAVVMFRGRPGRKFWARCARENERLAALPRGTVLPEVTGAEVEIAKQVWAARDVASQPVSPGSATVH